MHTESGLRMHRTPFRIREATATDALLSANSDSKMAALTRIAIITGAARGIGRSTALRLADDGLDVALNDIAQQKENLDEVVKEIEAKGRKAVAITGDVSKEEDVKAMVEKTVEVLGGVDCVRSIFITG